MDTVVELRSNPDFYFLDQSNVRFFKKVMITDSIFKLFPTCEIFIPDHQGQFSERLFFVEGLDFEIKIGSLEQGFVTHNFFAAETQMNDTFNANYINGVRAFSYLSSFKKQDAVKSKSFKKNISEIVAEVIKAYAFPRDNLSNVTGQVALSINIAETDNFNTWYQYAISDFAFFGILVRYAKSKNYSKCPYFTFINSLGQFYFSDLNSLLSQTPVARLKLSNDRNSSLDRHVIQKYTTQFTGSLTNFEQYKKEFYKVDEYGSYKRLETKLNEYIAQTKGGDILNIRSDDLDVLRDSTYFGLSEDDNTFLGFIDNKHAISSFPFLFKCGHIF